VHLFQIWDFLIEGSSGTSHDEEVLKVKRQWLECRTDEWFYSRYCYGSFRMRKKKELNREKEPFFKEKFKWIFFFNKDITK